MHHLILHFSMRTMSSQSLMDANSLTKPPYVIIHQMTPVGCSGFKQLHHTLPRDSFNLQTLDLAQCYHHH